MIVWFIDDLFILICLWSFSCFQFHNWCYSLSSKQTGFEDCRRFRKWCKDFFDGETRSNISLIRKRSTHMDRLECCSTPTWYSGRLCSTRDGLCFLSDFGRSCCQGLRLDTYRMFCEWFQSDIWFKFHRIYSKRNYPQTLSLILGKMYGCTLPAASL